MTRNKKLEQKFQQRLLDNLAEHNTLRGLWAEAIVAWFLDGWDPSEPWVYYDLMRGDGKKMSVKQSAGRNPKFSIKGQDSAVIPKSERTLNDDGWRYPASGQREDLCDVYTFAWLPDEDAPLALERVLDPNEWRFMVASRPAMYLDLPGPSATSISANRLQSHLPALTGDQLQHAVDQALLDTRKRAGTNRVPAVRLDRG